MVGTLLGWMPVQWSGARRSGGVLMLPSDPQSRPRPRKRWRLLGLLPLASVLLGLGLPPLLRLLMELGTQPRTEAIAPAQVADDVAGCLMQWRVFGNIPESTAVRQSVVRRMRGVHGFRYRGWNGEGFDCYEVELTPALAAEIKASLARLESLEEHPPATSLTFQKCSTANLPFGSLRPPWWPTGWPADSPAYSKNLTCFMLSPDGARAWLLLSHD